MLGYLRSDGRKGIRDVLVVAYLVECAHHVARRIVDLADDPNVHLIGFPGCYPNVYAAEMMKALVTHPNVGGALLVSLGCESFDRESLLHHVLASERPAELLVIQKSGGTRRTVDEGLAAVRRLRSSMNGSVTRAPLTLAELVVGTVCGGSDGTSGLTANPAVGRAFDRLVDAGATCIFEETGEMIGCEGALAERAATSEVARQLKASVEKAERYYLAMGHGSFAPGNADGGLSSQEEKSAGAYAKSGTRPISGLLLPAQQPRGRGLYLLDVVPDGDPMFGFPNISDNAEIVELISCGAHMTLFTTGRGSVVGSAISPVIKVCANPDTYRALSEDMDIDAGRILEGRATLNDVGNEIFSLVQKVAHGRQTVSESLGHREFVLTYKRFEAAGPACYPA